MAEHASSAYADRLLRALTSAELLFALAVVTLALMAVVAFAEGRREVAAPMALLAMPVLVILALLELAYRARRASLRRERAPDHNHDTGT